MDSMLASSLFADFIGGPLYYVILVAIAGILGFVVYNSRKNKDD